MVIASLCGAVAEEGLAVVAALPASAAITPTRTWMAGGRLAMTLENIALIGRQHDMSPPRGDVYGDATQRWIEPGSVTPGIDLRQI
jgi:hypothetical protein